MAHEGHTTEGDLVDETQRTDGNIEAVPRASAGGRAFRTVILIIMDLLVIAAIAVTARLVIEFFGQLAAQEWGKTVVSLTERLVIPFGVEAIKTPYGGVFGVNEALSVVSLLVVEWVLSVVRSR